MPTDITLNRVVIRYPHLTEMWSGSPSIEPDYNCQIIFPQDFAQWEDLQATVNEAITKKFGTTPPGNMKLPWLNKYLQPNTQKDGPYQGCYFLSANGKGTKPGVVDANAQPIPDLQIKQMVFSGCIVNAYLNFAGYTQGPGVGSYLIGIQLVDNNVEPIADAGRDLSQVFKAVPGAPAPLTAPPGAPAAEPTPFGGADPLVKPPW